MKKSIVFIIILLIVIAVCLASLLYSNYYGVENSKENTCNFMTNPLGTCLKEADSSSKINVALFGREIKAG